jgi:hypothetical protein
MLHQDPEQTHPLHRCLNKKNKTIIFFKFDLKRVVWIASQQALHLLLRLGLLGCTASAGSAFSWPTPRAASTTSLPELLTLFSTGVELFAVCFGSITLYDGSGSRGMGKP